MSTLQAKLHHVAVKIVRQSVKIVCGEIGWSGLRVRDVARLKLEIVQLQFMQTIAASRATLMPPDKWLSVNLNVQANSFALGQIGRHMVFAVALAGRQHNHGTEA